VTAAASFGPITLTAALCVGSFILDIWIFSLLVRSTWSAHLSRRIGRANRLRRVTNLRAISPADIRHGGLADGLKSL
jgi:hypothetical protein